MVHWLGAEPDDALDGVLLRMVDHHAGLPCPTRLEISQWTGMSRRRVWKYLFGMTERGLLEIEVSDSRESAREPKRRRLRRPGGQWTGWTKRGGPRQMEAAE